MGPLIPKTFGKILSRIHGDNGANPVGLSYPIHAET